MRFRLLNENRKKENRKENKNTSNGKVRQCRCHIEMLESVSHNCLTTKISYILNVSFQFVCRSKIGFLYIELLQIFAEIIIPKSLMAPHTCLCIFPVYSLYFISSFRQISTLIKIYPVIFIRTIHDWDFATRMMRGPGGTYQSQNCGFAD